MDKENWIELDVFAVKAGIRYKVKTINVNDISKILVDSILDGIGNIIGAVDNNNPNKGEVNNELTYNMQ